MNIIVTGGAGFIGSNLVKSLIKDKDNKVCVIDNLTYAANLESLDEVSKSERYEFYEINICDTDNLKKIFKKFKPNLVMHLAAESHVDRSITGPADFIKTNIVGTFSLLEVSNLYYHSLISSEKDQFRFHHISTDEVYGDLPHPDYSESRLEKFLETTPYNPSSPYSASKASSDHLVRAWKRTYEIPTLITNCSNNYGPSQNPEKLIPLVIKKCLHNEKIPVYGKGDQIRDWLYVQDHVDALISVAHKGTIGETYNIGGNNELRNIEVIENICSKLDGMRPLKNSYSDLITTVEDRPGHDLRYAIDASKIKDELNWQPKETFSSGLDKTISWYLNNPQWFTGGN